jgi:hypothetical protein
MFGIHVRSRWSWRLRVLGKTFSSLALPLEITLCDVRANLTNPLPFALLRRTGNHNEGITVYGVHD